MVGILVPALERLAVHHLPLVTSTPCILGVARASLHWWRGYELEVVVGLLGQDASGWGFARRRPMRWEGTGPRASFELELANPGRPCVPV